MTFLSIKPKTCQTGINCRIDRQLGSSLIETLVSMLLVSVGMMAAAGSISTAIAVGKSAENKVMANFLIADIVERIQSNKQASASYVLKNEQLKKQPPEPKACRLPLACTASERAEIDLAEWQASLLAQLPDGTGVIERTTGATTFFDIWIVWKELKSLTINPSAGSVQGETQSSTCPKVFESIKQGLYCLHVRVLA